jgi:hypothetical protein
MYAYEYEKFANAVTDLATGTDTIQVRILSVCREHLRHVTVGNLPERLKADFKNLSESLHLPDVYRDTGYLLELSDTEAADLAKKICEFAFRIRQDYEAPCLESAQDTP